MKSKFSLSIVLIIKLFAAFHASQAAVLTVDNSSASPGIYSTINAAVSAAQAGDTIYLQPTGLQYTSATIGKPVYIIGPGHTLSWTTALAEVASITIQEAGSGTTLEGIVIDGIVNLSFNVINVTIRNCRFAGVSSQIVASTNCHNMLVEGNVFQNYTSVFEQIRLANNSQNVLIKNNFFRLNSTGSSVSVLKNTNITTTFDQNTVIIANTGGVYCGSCDPHTISNNLWIGRDQNISSGAGGSTFYNNLTWSTTSTFNVLPGDNNLDNVEPVFVNVPSYLWSVGRDYNLVEVNVGYNGSSGGGQVGMYGGGFDFRKRGEPSGIPTFDQVKLLNTTVPQDGTIQIHVKAKKGLN